MDPNYQYFFIAGSRDQTISLKKINIQNNVQERPHINFWE